MKSQKFLIARIGRTVGLKGDLKLHLLTDFPEQFTPGALFESTKGTLEVEHYDPKRGTICFAGYPSAEHARLLTNAELYSSIDQTREQIELGEGEYFWFDIIGAAVTEKGEKLGMVEAIERILDTDYLSVKTDPSFTDTGMPASFLLPYIPRYIVSFDRQTKVIVASDARELLEASG